MLAKFLNSQDLKWYEARRFRESQKQRHKYNKKTGVNMVFSVL